MDVPIKKKNRVIGKSCKYIDDEAEEGDSDEYDEESEEESEEDECEEDEESSDEDEEESGGEDEESKDSEMEEDSSDDEDENGEDDDNSEEDDESYETVDEEYLDDMYGPIVRAKTNIKVTRRLVKKNCVTSAHVEMKSGKVVNFDFRVKPQFALDEYRKTIESKDALSWVLRWKENAGDPSSEGDDSGDEPKSSSKKKEEVVIETSDEDDSESDCEDEPKLSKKKSKAVKKLVIETSEEEEVSENDDDDDDDDESEESDSEDEATSKKKKKKTKIGSKKGKHVHVKQNGESSDSEEESDGAVKMSHEVMLKMMKNVAGGASGKTFSLIASMVMRDDVSGFSSQVIVIPRLSSVFYLKADFLKSYLKIYELSMKTPFGAKDSNVDGNTKWIDTIANFKVTASPHAVNRKWKRTGNKGNTTDLIYFVISVPTEKEKNLKDLLDYIVKKYFRKAFKKNGNAGELCVDCLLDSAPSGPNSGLHGYIVKSKGNGNRETTVDNVSTELSEFFTAEPSVTYESHLDQFMVDYDIKYILENHFGYNSWDDASEAIKQACFKNYPKQKLPQWDGIVQESY